MTTIVCALTFIHHNIHQYFLQSFFSTESTKYYIMWHQTFPWFSILPELNKICSIVLLEVRSYHFISSENVLLLHHCDVSYALLLLREFSLTETFHQWIRGASQAYAVVQQPITTSDWFVSVFRLRALNSCSDTDCNARIKSIYPRTISVCLSGYQQVYVCTCVSVSTKVHAGLCLGPDCLPSARHYSSGPGPHHNASAQTDPILLCGEGQPVYSDDIHDGSTRWTASSSTNWIYCNITVYLPTWKMAFHVLSNTSSSRSLSSQPLKYNTHGGRNWVRSAANSYSGTKWSEGLH